MNSEEILIMKAWSVASEIVPNFYDLERLLYGNNFKIMDLTLAEKDILFDTLCALQMKAFDFYLDHMTERLNKIFKEPEKEN